ncbi:MAG: BspA family leucine-rich repeat surface protein, partial [Olleya sp.]
SFNYELDYNSFSVNKFVLSTENTEFNAQATLNLNASASTSIPITDYTLYENSKTVVRFVGGIPIVVTTFLKLKATSELDIGGNIAFSKKLEHNTSFSLGATYENDNWDTIAELDSGFIEHPVNLEGSYVNLTDKITLVPEVIIAFYGINTAKIEPSLKGDLGINVGINQDWDASLNGNIDLSLGASVGVLGETLVSLPFDSYDFYNQTLWNAPDTMEIVSGNNQTGNEGQQLNESIKVKILDSSGSLSLENVQVYFNVTEGDGSVSEGIVMTDENGIAETNWTLGENTDSQTLLVSIKDASDNIIAEVNFTATSEMINSFYIDDNGVTIKSFPDVTVGTVAMLNGVEYTLVDRDLLISMRDNGDDISRVVTTAVTDMSFVFTNTSSFNQDISSWDLSNVTDMSYLFANANNFKQDLSYWDTSNVENFEGTFGGINNFNSDISIWDTSSATNMTAMFNGADNFNQDIDNWDTSNVSTMEAMFKDTINFNQNIGSWNTVNVTNMFEMFRNANSFNHDISGWNTGNVLDMGRMFDSAENFNQDIGSWNTSNVLNMAQMFKFALNFNQDISVWDTSNVISIGEMFYGANNFNQNIGGWNTSNVISISRIFMFATNFN